MKIEAARAADLPAIMALRQRLLQEGSWFVAQPDEESTQLAPWQRLLETGILRVARQGPLVVGVVMVRPGGLRRQRHVGALEIFLDEGWRGKGVGRALMEDVLREAPARGVEKLSLAVYADNLRAVALYKSLGFQEEGHRRGEYRMADGSYRDDLLMARWLSPPPPPLPATPPLSDRSSERQSQG